MASALNGHKPVRLVSSTARSVNVGWHLYIYFTEHVIWLCDIYFWKYTDGWLQYLFSSVATIIK